MTVLNRRPGIASVTTIGVLALTMAVAQLVAPCWTREAGLDVWNYPSALIDEQETEEERLELIAAHARLQEQIDAAEHVAELVIEERMTIPEAIDRILAINADRPRFLEILRTGYAKDAQIGTRQLVADYLLLKVRDLLRHNPARQRAVLERLRAEYHALGE